LHGNAGSIVTFKTKHYLDNRFLLRRESHRVPPLRHILNFLALINLVNQFRSVVDHADANPLVSMKLKKEKPEKKPELTDGEIHTIVEALHAEPEWMQTAFEISLHTGCRLRETRIPMNCIDFNEDKITFPSPKGGEDRAFSIPMPTALRPLFERLRKARRKPCSPLDASLWRESQATPHPAFGW
jgi:integrase